MSMKENTEVMSGEKPTEWLYEIKVHSHPKSFAHPNKVGEASARCGSWEASGYGLMRLCKISRRAISGWLFYRGTHDPYRAGCS
jgi:hypothetical protein